MAGIADIEGIGPVYAQKLKEAGVKTVEGLLKTGSSPAGRKALEEKTGISHKLVLEWVNRADLFRIKGVAEECSDLLVQAGVDSVIELSKRVPEHLLEKMVEINNAKKLIRRLPTLAQVKEWVEQAKNLPRMVTY